MNNAGVSRYKFRRNYRCYFLSQSIKDRLPSAEYGGKIILPPSALDILTKRDAEFPLLFKICNVASKVSTHVGVLEFIAEDGKAYIPRWIMEYLGVQEGQRVRIENATLPQANFTCLQPQSVSFLNITNPKAVLESTLRHFSCLTVGDIICIFYNNQEYKLKVLNTKPGGAVKIIECDMEVDFEKPVGYVEKQSSANDTNDEAVPTQEFVPFTGKGFTLSGKKRKFDDSISTTSNISKKPAPRGIPDFEYKVGTLIFTRNRTLPLPPSGSKTFTPFQGAGKSLKQT